MRLIAVGTNGFRLLFTKKPVTKMGDLKGIKLRLAASPVMQRTWETWGASAYAMAWSETFTAIQQGVMDAFECPTNILLYNGFYPYTSHVAENLYYCPQIFLILVNERWYQNLSPEQKIFLNEAAAINELEHFAWVQAEYDDVRKQLVNHGGRRMPSPCGRTLRKCPGARSGWRASCGSRRPVPLSNVPIRAASRGRRAAVETSPHCGTTVPEATMLRNLWEHFEVYIANFSLLLMVGFLTLQIIGRYFFQVGIAWTEELSRFSFLYFVYLSSCFVMMKGRHIRVECLVNVLPLSVRNWIEVFGDMLQIAFCLVAAYAGSLLLVDMIEYPVYSPSLMLPLFYFYGVIPLAFFIMALRIVQRLYHTFSAS